MSFSFLFCCYFCGKPLFRTDFVCDRCLVVPELKEREHRGLRHLYLFDYDEYSQVFIKNLKYGKFANSLQKLCYRFPMLSGQVIALPNSKNMTEKANHSYVFANGVFPHAKVHEPFIKVSEKQARRSKQERRKISLKIEKSFQVDGPVILIDDLLTTGCTVTEAWGLLGKPQATIITLSYTPKRHQ